MKYLFIFIFFIITTVLHSQFGPPPENYTRAWGTYFGDENLRIFQIDEHNDHLWVVGHIKQNSTFLDTVVTPNAHQLVYGGGTKDGFIAKLSNEGEVLYASYFGGEGEDEIYSIDIKGEKVYITGRTTSTTGIATSGSYEDVLQENFNPNGNSYGHEGSFIAQLDTLGVLQWATYYQGDRTTTLNMVKAGTANDLFVWGNTRSSDMASLGSFKDQIASPYLNDMNQLTAIEYPILARFNDTGQLIWATYYGPDIDATNTISGARAYGALGVDSMNNVYVAGVSGAYDYFGTPGTHQETNAGLYDVFFSKFSSSGQRIWSSYYGGTHLEWYVKLYVPRDDYIYLTGITTSENGIATADAFYSNYQHPQDIFGIYLAKINLQGQREWGTYVYNHPVHSDIIVDVDSHSYPFVYQPLNNIPGATTLGSWQENYAGGSDFSMIKLNQSGTSMEWGSYYGGNGSETVSFAQGDNSSNLFAISDTDEMYISGRTSSINNIVSQNAFQTSFPPFTHTGFIAKFIPCETTVLPIVASPQEYQPGSTLAELEVETVVWTGSTPIITWYEDANGDMEIVPETILQNGETYYVTQRIQGCDESDPVPVTVIACTPPDPPTGDATQTFTPGQTLEDLDVYGSNLTWYASDGSSGSPAVLPSNTPLQDGETYYVTQNPNGCESGFLGVTVLETMGMNDNEVKEITLYPNPNLGSFTIKGLRSGNTAIIILDVQGRTIYKESVESPNEEHSIKLQNTLTTGVYFLQVKSSQYTQVLRVLVER